MTTAAEKPTKRQHPFWEKVQKQRSMFTFYGTNMCLKMVCAVMIFNSEI